MKQLVVFAIALVFASAVAAWADDDSVPTTVEGGAHKMKEGGKDVGEGFRGIGRGIKDVFTGESSKENFKEGKKIGTGFADMGKGVGGVGRGAGRDIKEGFSDDDPPPPAHSGTLSEEKLD